MAANLANLSYILLLVATAVIGISGEVQITDGDLPEYWSQQRYAYDDSVSNPCESVILLGVGTAAVVSDYDGLLTDAVEQQSFMVIMVDPNPGVFVKFSSRFTTVTDGIIENLAVVAPVCTDKTTQRILIGGHSAGGAAAWESQGNVNYDVDGFVGLDPYKLDDSTGKSNVPGIFVGFTRTTCLVAVENAAQEGYIETTDNRVYYQIKNPIRTSTHCSFTDVGCRLVSSIVPSCRAREPYSASVQTTAAEGIQRFVAALSSGTWNKSDFDLGSVPDISMTLFVNEPFP